MAKKKKIESSDFQGTGRRKTAIARVRLKPGTGRIVVNRREMNAYFCNQDERLRVLAPLQAVNAGESFDVVVRTSGGGTSAQSGAISLGIARALLRSNPDHEEALRDGKFLTRDGRQKERKKYGRRGARRSFQFSKR